MMKLFFWCALLSINSIAIAIQHSHLTNNWYPTNKEQLKRTITDLSSKAAKDYAASIDSSQIRAIIVPHAAYAYSGTVATAVYRLLPKQQIKKVIILAPDHAVSFNGVALPNFDRYQTPRGILQVDTNTINELSRQPLFLQKRSVFEREHSLEMQLPLIQYFLPNASIVPLIVGAMSCEQSQTIARALKRMIDATTLVIVTTDFTHYGKQFNFTPFNDHIALRIRNLDSQAIQLIEKGSCTEFACFITQSHATICGHYPLQILLSLIEENSFGHVEPRLIAYDTSGNQENSSDHSVSYIGMLFTNETLASKPIQQQLTQQEQRGLLQESRDILHNLYDKSKPIDLLYPLLSFGVTRYHGAFTTLEKMVNGKKELRGCIGRIVAEEPLYKTINTVTQDTALRDSRFLPVEKKELPELLLKLSILADPKPVKSYKDIVIGKHGVIFKYNNASSVFLPEVPVEFGWNLEETLTQLSIKAGLDKDTWKKKEAQFLVFDALDIY